MRQDEMKAIEWLQKATELGFTSAFSALGDHYAAGIGFSVDLEEAFSWYSKAAEEKDSYGEVAVGNAYVDGNGVGRV